MSNRRNTIVRAANGTSALEAILSHTIQVGDPATLRVWEIDGDGKRTPVEVTNGSHTEILTRTAEVMDERGMVLA